MSYLDRYANTPPPAAPAGDPVSLAVCELLARFELGHYRRRPAVQARLAEIFATNPPGSLDLLTRAAAHLGVTGEHADALLDGLLASWPTGLLEESPADRLAEPGAHVGGAHGNP